MFAKGPMPRSWSAKRALLVRYPEARCRRETRMGITGYILYLTEEDERNDKGFVSRGRASEVWEDACIKLNINAKDR